MSAVPSDPVVLLRPRDARQLCAAVRSTVALEIRRAGLMHEPDPYLPLPTDLDAEAEVLSAVVDGHVTLAELAPLEARHLYADLHRAIWEAASECAPGDIDGVHRALVARGWRGSVDLELARLLVGQPWRCLTRLRTAVARLVELSRQREIIAGIQRVNLGLRRDAISSTDALASLALLVEELRT